MGLTGSCVWFKGFNLWMMEREKEATVLACRRVSPISETCGICRLPKKEMARRKDNLNAQEHSGAKISSVTTQERRAKSFGKNLFVLNTYLTLL